MMLARSPGEVAGLKRRYPALYCSSCRCRTSGDPQAMFQPVQAAFRRFCLRQSYRPPQGSQPPFPRSSRTFCAWWACWISCADSCLASKVLKPRNDLTTDLNRFLKHLLGAHPKAVVAVFLPIDDEFFLGFAVQSHAEDRVLLALVVPVAAWLHGGHGMTPWNLFHSCMTLSRWSPTSRFASSSASTAKGCPRNWPPPRPASTPRPPASTAASAGCPVRSDAWTATGVPGPTPSPTSGRAWKSCSAPAPAGRPRPGSPTCSGGP